MRKMIVGLAALSLVACSSVQTNVVNPVLTDISRINNTAIADLTNAQAVAKAATPADMDGYNCATTVIAVAGQINAVVTAAKGPGAGPLSNAELASLFQPGSQQFNAVQQQLTSGCAAKAQDVLGAAGVTLAGGVAGAMATTNLILPLAAAAP